MCAAGTFLAVGAVRKPGTTVIIEDAVAVPDLAAACLIQPFAKHGHIGGGIIFGHALEGERVHFVFTQDFSIESEVARYAAFMDE